MQFYGYPYVTTQELYHHFNQKIPFIQRLACELAKDFDKARFLYQETFHRAMRQKSRLKPDSLDSWLNQTIKEAYLDLA